MAERWPEAELLYVGSRLPADRQLVEAAGLRFQPITAGKLRRYWSWQNFVDGFKFLTGLRQAHQLIRGFGPDVVFAKGGYVSLPVVLAARRLGVPVVVHESDSRLGLANRLAIPSATKIAVAFPVEEYFKHQPGLVKYRSKFIYTGLPLPKTLVAGEARPIFKNRRLTLLVTGGSQGAAAINETIWQILPELVNRYNVIHQAGTMGLTEAERRREGLPAGLEEYYRPFGFDAEFYQQALKAADAVVARAGSMVFELQALRKPAILIPLPHSAGGHQHRNAKFLVERGAVVAIDQRDLKSATLLALIEQVMGDEALRDRLSRNLEELGKINLSASQTLADLVMNTAQYDD